MWYRFCKIIIAKTRDEHLREIGVAEDVISFINSSSDQEAKSYFFAVNKNPKLTVQDLRNLPKKQLPSEHLFRLMVNAWFSEQTKFTEWLIKRLNSKFNESKNARIGLSAKNIFDLYVPNFLGWRDFYNAQVRDNPRFDIFSYSIEQIRQLSDEWHRVQVGKGAGKMYEPTKHENIVYRFENPPGWTIQKITSSNDLLAEGNKMNHCVGNYCDNLENGNNQYFSLRDENNKAIVTLDTDSTGNLINQIQANSNSEPSKEVKSLLAEWFKKNPNMKWEYNNYDIEDDLEDLRYSKNYSKLDDDLIDIFNKMLKGKDDYGLPISTNLDIEQIYSQVLNIFQGSRNRDNNYGSDMHYAARTIGKYAVEFDKKRLKDFKTNHKILTPTKWRTVSSVAELEYIRDRHYEDLDDYYADSWTTLDGAPDIDDYENEEDYDKAFEEHEEEERQFNEKQNDEYRDDYIKSSLPCGFDLDIAKAMNDAISEDVEYNTLLSEVVSG